MNGEVSARTPSAPIDCDVTGWSEWGACNKISESKARFRTVQIQPSNNGRACPALQEEGKCLIDCDVTGWSEWGACNKISESKARFRTVQIQPSNNGRACPALQEEGKCLIDCDVTRWSPWEACSAKSGQMKRDRRINVQPSKSGQRCPLLEDAAPCQVDCVLADWQLWGPCSASCDGGERLRVRTGSVEPKNGGRKCGKNEDQEPCSQVPCYLLDLRSAIQRKCEIEDQAEMHKILKVLVSTGVRKVYSKLQSPRRCFILLAWCRLLTSASSAYTTSRPRLSRMKTLATIFDCFRTVASKCGRSCFQ